MIKSRYFAILRNVFIFALCMSVAFNIQLALQNKSYQESLESLTKAYASIVENQELLIKQNNKLNKKLRQVEK